MIITKTQLFQCRRLAAILLLAGLASFHCQSQEVIYVEGFNDDGEGTRYTIHGRGVDENIAGQAGPGYWEHSFNVSVVGIPAIAPARRVIYTWNHNITPGAVTPEALELFDSTVTWLTKGKANARILFSPPPSGSGDEILVQRLQAQGHVIEEDFGDLPAASSIDLVIHSSNGSVDPNRFTFYAAPLLTYNGPDHDDELTSSIGLSGSVFDPGAVTIAAPDHPVAGGKTGSLTFVTEPQPFDTVGASIPDGSTVVATYAFTRIPAVNNLAQVDEMVAGTLAGVKHTGTITSADLHSGAAGDWFFDNEPPGAPSGSFATLATGSIQVNAPGTYSFALGVDDGGRFRIDLDRNGFSSADNIIVMDSSGGFRVTTADVTFTAAGSYDFEWATFNSGGAYGSEVSVSFLEGGGTQPPIDFNNWELLGDHFGNPPVQLSGPITVTTYIPDWPAEVEQRPLIVAIEEDGPLLGGLITGHEGAGFFAGAALNKFGSAGNRTLTLNPVNVAGKENVKLTFAVAGTDVDFEDPDFLRVLIDIDGNGPAPFRTLVEFLPVGDGSLSDGTTVVRTQFQDVTYDIPPEATQLVVRFEAFNTWFNEIIAFDHVRITAGDLAPPPTPTLAIRSEGANLVLEFTGRLESAQQITGPWTPVPANPSSPLTLTAQDLENQRFYRTVGP
jgi:hypothetical protein